MIRMAIALLGLALLLSACGGNSSEGGAATGSALPSADFIRSALEEQLAGQLLLDLPLLTSEEAGCISDAVLAGLPDFEDALDDPLLFTEILLGSIVGAQESCLTPDRIAELEADQALASTPEPDERTFLLVIRGATQGLTADDQELISAGYLMCRLAEDAGSLGTLLTRIATTPNASEELAAQLSPLLGRVLSLDELLAFSSNAIAILCLEVNEG